VQFGISMQLDVELVIVAIEGGERGKRSCQINILSAERLFASFDRPLRSVPSHLR
jgi:hypothetical protein